MTLKLPPSCFFNMIHQGPHRQGINATVKTVKKYFVLQNLDGTSGYSGNI